VYSVRIESNVIVMLQYKLAQVAAANKVAKVVSIKKNF